MLRMDVTCSKLMQVVAYLLHCLLVIAFGTTSVQVASHRRSG